MKMRKEMLRESMNALRHGFRSRTMRALAFESQEATERAMRMAMESIGPRNAAEAVVCARLALSFCKLERLERFERDWMGLGDPGEEALLTSRYLRAELNSMREQMVVLAWLRA